ncbi:MAG: family 16 glycoside hydrolase [Fermentimonas sp.]
MKNIRYLIVALCLIFAGQVKAQLAEGRTTSTIIADALAQLPAETPKAYEAVMSDLVKTGEEGMLDLIGRLNPPGKDSNETYEFAINGWVDYVAKDETNRKIAANAFEKALREPLDKDVKAFVIRQLRTIGDDDNIDVLTEMLGDEYLISPASLALASLDSDMASQALLNALRMTNNEDDKIDLVNALGQTSFEAAEPVMLEMLNNNTSDNLEKVLLNALAHVGSVNSIKPLRSAAEKSDFDYEKSNAVASYTKLLTRLNKTDSKAVAKEANKLMSVAKKNGRNDLKTTATSLLLEQSDANKSKSIKSVIKDGDAAYLTAVLDNYYTKPDSKTIEEVEKAVASTKSPELLIPMINWVGRHNTPNATTLLIGHINSTDKDVQKAVARNLSKLGGEKSLLALAGMLKSNDSETIKIGKNALMSYKGDMSYTLASVYDSSTDEGKKAILELISDRKMYSQYNLVYNQMFLDNEEVKVAAANTLKDVSKDSNLPDLFNLLEQSDAKYTSSIQNAITAALSFVPTEDRAKIVVERMNKSKKPELYYSALASIGTQESIDVIANAYDGNKKNAVIDALALSDNFHAIYPLLDFARESKDKAELERITNALVSMISKSDETNTIKYLYLREAMQFAQNDKQKNQIIRQLGATGQYQAMIFVAPYMDVDALKESAAVATMNIGISDPTFAGDITTELLNKASKTLSNPDANYQRQSIEKYLTENGRKGGWVSMFNGKNLDGWKGLVENPIKRAGMSKKEMTAAQVKADEQMAKDWKVENGLIVFDGKGYDNLCTVKQYGDFEMLVDWKLFEGPEPDAGIYLRGTPQVQMWDTARVNVGAEVGSGGLYNNKVHESKPLKVADQKVGEWNSFLIRMVGERVSVWLNGELVTDNVILENFWDREQPIFPIEQIELQAHGSKVAYRDIYIKEIERPEPFMLSEEEKAEGFKILFDGTNMDEWIGNKVDYTLESGTITVYPGSSAGGTRNLYTKDEYDNFVFRFEFMLTPGANNGLGIRTPTEGDAAYVGMELQILDNDAPIYETLHKYQYHGSVYGVIPAKRGALKPVGEWNYQEVIADGDHIKVILNGVVIVDGNIREASNNGTKTMDGKQHPGLLNKSGHIGFLGHGSKVKFRNIRIKEL